MPDETATQRTIQFIKAQLKELEPTIKQLESQLEKARQDHNTFLNLLEKLQEEENSSSQIPQESDEMEEIDSSNSEVTGSYQTASAVDESDNETLSDVEIDETSNEDEETVVDNVERSEEDNSSPKDWLYPQYQDRPMEDVILEILQQCQPAKPSDVALRIYQIGEDDPNFYRARNSANAALTNGKKAKKWKSLKRGVYVLNSYPETFQADLGQNGHHKAYQTAQ
jgi:hypothetical protein